MPDELLGEPVFLLIVSVLIVLAMFIKAGARKLLKIPPVVGYIVLGALLRAGQEFWQIMPAQAEWTLDFMAQMGVAALLFRIGLKSDVAALATQLPRALGVWISDVVVSAGLAFTVAWSLGLGLIPSLFVAAALSATSVGISVTIWEDAGQIKTPVGQLLLDVAELDDLSAVLLMLIVLAAAPVLLQGGPMHVAALKALSATGLMLVKVALFAIGCWLFSYYLEERLTRFLARAELPPDRLLSIVGVGFAVAALAGTIGFSVAVGALFAGLMFSRDPQAVHEEASFAPIYALFMPFFFIDIGYALNLREVVPSLAVGLLLFVPAVAGKVIGAGAPVWRSFGISAGVIMGVSMVPRAEIALLVVRTGNRLGPWAVSDEVYGAMVCACGLASIASPLVLQALLARRPQATSPVHDPRPDDGRGEKLL